MRRLRRLKLVAKLSFACLLLLGVVITFVTTSAWTAEMSEESMGCLYSKLVLASNASSRRSTSKTPFQLSVMVRFDPDKCSRSDR